MSEDRSSKRTCFGHALLEPLHPDSSNYHLAWACSPSFADSANVTLKCVVEGQDDAIVLAHAHILAAASPVLRDADFRCTGTIQEQREANVVTCHHAKETVLLWLRYAYQPSMLGPHNLLRMAPYLAGLFRLAHWLRGDVLDAIVSYDTVRDMSRTDTQHIVELANAAEDLGTEPGLVSMLEGWLTYRVPHPAMRELRPAILYRLLESSTWVQPTTAKGTIRGDTGFSAPFCFCGYKWTFDAALSFAEDEPMVVFEIDGENEPSVIQKTPVKVTFEIEMSGMTVARGTEEFNRLEMSIRHDRLNDAHEIPCVLTLRPAHNDEPCDVFYPCA